MSRQPLIRQRSRLERIAQLQAPRPPVHDPLTNLVLALDIHHRHATVPRRDLAFTVAGIGNAAASARAVARVATHSLRELVAAQLGSKPRSPDIIEESPRGE